MYNSSITGMGMYVPENVVTNEDLTQIMDTSNEWILERTGIEERRHIKKGDGNTTATMGVKAAKIAGMTAVAVPDKLMDSKLFLEADLVLDSLVDFPLENYFPS